MSLAEQLGNIGSEFARFAAGQQHSERQRNSPAAARCLELIDLTVADPRWQQGGRWRELTRLREVCFDVFTNGQRYAVSVESLQEYFLPFAIAARR